MKYIKKFNEINQPQKAVEIGGNWSYWTDGEGNNDNKAYIDGYNIADRLLEDVMFCIEVLDNGGLKCYAPNDNDYIDDLNWQKFMNDALSDAVNCGYGFTHNIDGNGNEVYLVDKNGKSSSGKMQKKAIPVKINKSKPLK